MRNRLYIAVIPILVLLVLGGLNIHRKITWKEPTDGIIWKRHATGLKAVKMEEGSQAALFSGIKQDDILYSIGIFPGPRDPVHNQVDVAKKLWEAWILNRNVSYEIVQEGSPQTLTPKFSVGERGVDLLYFYMALIGVTTLIIGFIIFFRTRKPLALPYLFFFLVTLAFSAYHIFSATGEQDALDGVFYWLDKIGLLAFPPLLLHYFIIFPRRKKLLRRLLSSVYFLYLPAAVLLLARIFIHLPNVFRLSEDFILRYFFTIEKLELLHFSLFSLIALGMIVTDTFKATHVFLKRQLKWIVYGLGLGIIPFTVFYVTPFLLGQVPARAAEMTVILQALIPLTFAYSISRYRLVDIEVILKKIMPLIFSYVIIALLYFIVSSQTNIFPENRLQAGILGILAIVLGATLFSPIKKLFQAGLERVIYRRSYKYRKTLLTISQEMSRERDLQRLSHSLLDHIANALSLEYIALLLPDEDSETAFSYLHSLGSQQKEPQLLTLNRTLFRFMRRADYISEDALSDRRELQPEFRKLAAFGIHHLMPLTVEDNLIGCLGMGRKFDGSLLKAEDWELLRTISSPMALALENAYLYNQAQIRTAELQNLKDYSENIIESLTVGVVVLDQQGRVTGWNRVMEETFGRSRSAALGGGLGDVLGPQNAAALFPSDTEQDLRLMSEIAIEMPSGGTRIFDIAKTPLLDNRMKPYGTIIVFEDTTEKMSLQQQLVTSEKLASVGLLSAGVAHEINTPLTGISSYVQMLQKKLAKTSHSTILEKIEVQTDRVARIVKSLLNFARNPSESGFYQMDLKETLQGIISLIDYKLKNMNIHLEIELDSIPLIWAQGERLQQVFINIILNALDAMPGGGTLTIRLSKEQGDAVVQISDTGAGISPQHLPHIFDPFFTTKGIGKGTGLGLSISYAIIQEHSGRIIVKSEEGQGTRFDIHVPMNLEPRPNPESRTPQTGNPNE